MTGLDLARIRLENLEGVGGGGGVDGGLSSIDQFSPKSPISLLIEGNDHAVSGGGSVALRVSSNGEGGLVLVRLVFRAAGG